MRVTKDDNMGNYMNSNINNNNNNSKINKLYRQTSKLYKQTSRVNYNGSNNKKYDNLSNTNNLSNKITLF